MPKIEDFQPLITENNRPSMRDIPQYIKDKLPFRGLYAIEDLSTPVEDVTDLLDHREQQILEEISNERRKKEFVTSRGALKKLAEQWNLKDFQLKKDDLGQPYGLTALKRYFVSIAHSRDKVFCGIAEKNAIGIDLEPADRTVPERLRSRMMHAGEKDTLPEVETIRLWTIKEAYIKLRGQGLRLNMNQVCIKQENEHFFVELNDDKSAKICSFQLQNDWLAIAHYQK